MSAMLFTDSTHFARHNANARRSEVLINIFKKNSFVHNSFFFCRSNLQRWQELADEQQQLNHTNLAAITAGTSTDDISDSSRTPPANNTRQPASS
jgi:hypothetical protein